MIEKLDLDNGYATVDWLPTQHGKRCGAKEIQTTVNQLVDAVNELQLAKDVMFSRIDILNDAICDIRNVAENGKSSKTEQDPYAEQRKWICKLCWFWNDDKSDKVVGILSGVFDEADRPFERNINQTLYKHCEPVKLDDDIIYKGGNNE
jgi:hypothetical protein